MTTLVEMVRECPVIELAVGSEVRANDLTDAVLIVVDEGLVVMRRGVVGSTRRTITCHAGAGGLILPPQEGEALAALTDVKLTKVSSDTRDRLLQTPESARILFDGLAETLRQKLESVASMSRVHHVDRIREKLLELARLHGRVGRDEVRLDFPLTHDLLAEMTGSARETVTRALDELQREGFVIRRGRTYSLHVPPATL